MNITKIKQIMYYYIAISITITALYSNDKFHNETSYKNKNLAPYSLLSQQQIPVIFKNPEINELASNIIKKYNIDYSGEAYENFLDISVNEHSLTSTLLPILKKLNEDKPDLILVLSNGGDPIGSQLYDMIEHYGTYKPDFINAFVPRKLVISEIMWNWLTQAERDHLLTQKEQTQIFNALELVIKNIKTNIKYPKQTLIESLEEIKDNLDKPFGEIILSLKAIVPERKNLSFLAKQYLDSYFTEIQPFLQLLLKNTKMAQFLHNKKITVLDEIVYTGDAIIKTDIIMKIFQPKSCDVSLLIDYTEARSEYENDPIGQDGLQKVGIKKVNYGRKARQGHWTLINMDVGPNYYPANSNDISLVLKNLQDGFALRFSEFGTEVFNMFQDYLKNNPFNRLSNDDSSFLTELNQDNIKELFLYSLKDFFYETKTSKKFPLQWKEEEWSSAVKKICKNKDPQLLNKIKYLVYTFFNDYIDQYDYYTKKLKPMSFERSVWINASSFKQYFKKIKDGESLIYKDPDFHALSKIFLESEQNNKQLALFLQLANYQFFKDQEYKNILNQLHVTAKSRKIST